MRWRSNAQVLLNIAPPDIWRRMHSNRILEIVKNNPKLHIYPVIINALEKRLKSRHLVWEQTACKSSFTREYLENLIKNRVSELPKL